MRILKCIVLVTLLAQSNGFFINTLGNVAKTIVDTAGKVIGTAGKTAENLVETSVNTVGNVIDTGVKTAGNVVETVVHTGVDVFCAVVGVLVPCREGRFKMWWAFRYHAGKVGLKCGGRFVTMQER
uniref:Uncharacterized protein n=1 Tax=Biomphalaria glabrata TaxID=6526 RepID=A0A2C9LUT6_BIOGL